MSRGLGVFAAALLGAACARPEPRDDPPMVFPPVSALPERPGLPDPFVGFDGTPVESREDWVERRRPELVALFQEYVYGVAPPAPEVRARVVTEGVPVLDGAAILREVELSFGGLPEAAPTILLALFLPPGEGPFPVFLGLNKCGNQTLVPDPVVTWRPRPAMHADCTEEGTEERGSRTDTWCVRELVARGYGLATFACADLDPDFDDPDDGIQPWYPELAGESRWGTIAAWAWGLSRAVDALVDQPRVDPRRIALIGHSRRGKTALLAGALDERVALVVPHQSGTGGCALSRDNDQETVERITRVFPHWFAKTFARFGGNEARLPVDQHLLVALVAPRPLLETVGLQDTWANFESSLRGLRAAAPVWTLLGASRSEPRVLGPNDPIATETATVLAQLRLDKPHVLDAEYWARILDFADLHLASRALPGSGEGRGAAFVRAQRPRPRRMPR